MGNEQGAPAFVPADEEADRAAVGYLAAALQNLQAACTQAARAGWGSNIRTDLEAAHTLTAAIVADLA